MEPGRGPLSEEIISDKLYQLFLKKGYPPQILKKNVTHDFSLNGNFSFTLKFPLTVEAESPLLITYYDPSQGGLGLAVRPLLAKARVLFKALPIYAVLTNLFDFILIEVASGKTSRGDESVIPDYTSLAEKTPTVSSKFNVEIERKIIALFLSCG